MSVDNAREYHSDLSQLKYLNSIPRGRISFDLNHNIHIAVNRTTDDNDEKINLLLKFFLDQSNRLSQVWPDDDLVFITYRRTIISVVYCGLRATEPRLLLLHYLTEPFTPWKHHSKNKDGCLEIDRMMKFVPGVISLSNTYFQVILYTVVSFD